MTGIDIHGVKADTFTATWYVTYYTIYFINSWSLWIRTTHVINGTSQELCALVVLSWSLEKVNFFYIIQIYFICFRISLNPLRQARKVGLMDPLLLIWINFNPSMDKSPYALKSMGWNYLSIPKLRKLYRWSLGMDKWLIPHSKIDLITYSCWDCSWSMLVKGAPGK